MDKLSSLHLTHEYPSFHGCTNKEAFLISGLVALIELVMVLLASLYLSHFIHSYFGTLIIGVIFCVIVDLKLVPFIAKRVGKMREGKAYGYVSTRFLIQASQTEPFNLLVKSPFLVRQGIYATERPIAAERNTFNFKSIIGGQ